MDLVKNLWTVAVNRANKTAMALAAIIQRSNLESVVLVGHSLGGRVMLNLATALAGAAGTENGVRVEAVHLLGSAIDQDAKWEDLTPVWWTPDIQPSRAGRKVIYHHVQVLRTVQTRCRGPLRKQ